MLLAILAITLNLKAKWGFFCCVVGVIALLLIAFIQLSEVDLHLGLVIMIDIDSCVESILVFGSA